MGKAIKLSKDMVGKKVRCICKDNYYYPEARMIGTIVEYDWQDKDISYKVQWPKGSTFGEDCWWVANKYIELVEDDEASKQEIPNMTNEEIWGMLWPKMDKNGLKEYFSYVSEFTGDDFKQKTQGVFLTEDVINAIAVAYRSGYERCMKGRPFKLNSKEQKEGGYWKPVNPNSLPKDGTKVRYARKNNYYNDGYIKLYDTGVVEYKDGIFGKEFGMKLDKVRRKECDWVQFDCTEDSLDMWVEDDE